MKRINLEYRKIFSACLLVMLIIAFNLTGQNVMAQENSVSDGSDFQFYLEGNKAGLKDAEGNIITPAIYNDLRGFQEGYAAVNIGAVIKNIRIVDAITINGFTIPAEYADKLIGGKWGFIDLTGKETVPCSYEYVKNFHNGIAAVNTGGKTKYHHNVLTVTGGKWGFVDTDGKEIIPCKYDEVKEFSNGLAAVCDNGKWGFIDKIGSVIIPCTYEDAGSFHDNRACVKQKKKFGYIDETGKNITPLQYDDANDFLEGLALVSLKNKYGFIDKNGNEIVPLQYDYADSFSEGLAVVNIGGKWKNMGSFNGFNGGKWGFIDTKGNIVIPLQYEHAKPFKNGSAEVIEKDGIPATIGKP